MYHTLHLTKVAKLGTSKGIIIPSEILHTYKWERGDTLVFVFASENALTLRKLTEKEMIHIKDNARKIDFITNEEIK